LANSGEAGGGDVEETDLGTVPEDEEVLVARRPPLRGQSFFSFLSVAALLMFYQQTSHNVLVPSRKLQIRI